VELRDVRVQALGERRHTRDLERTGGDHDLAGLIAAIVELDQIAALALADGPDTTANFDLQFDVARLVGLVGD
jgi:hypothetical protein